MRLKEALSRRQENADKAKKLGKGGTPLPNFFLSEENNSLGVPFLCDFISNPAHTLPDCFLRFSRGTGPASTGVTCGPRQIFAAALFSGRQGVKTG